MKIFDTHGLATGAVAARPDRPATALVLDTSDARVVLFRIEPGQEVAVHTSTSTVVLTVISGSGIVMNPDGDHAVRAGDMIAYDVQEPHGMRAADQQLVIAATITPRPGER